MFIQQSRLQESSPNNPFPSICSTLWDFLKAQMLLQLPGLPVWNLSNKLAGKLTSLFFIKYSADGFSEMAKLDLPSQKSARETWYGATISSVPNTRLPVRSTVPSGTEVSDESVFQLSDLFAFSTITNSSAPLTTFGTRGRAYITVSMAIYLLSNGFVEPTYFEEASFVHRAFFQTLESVFKETPARHLRDLLQSRLASVRAAFEALLNIAGILKHHFAFKTLVDIGIGNNWLARSAQGHQYLYHAVCMDMNEVVHQLLDSGCRPNKFARADQRTITTAIVAALERRNIQCVELLLKHCDINTPFQYGYDNVTSFTFFIHKACYLDEMLFGQGIRSFLDAGADINSPLGYDWYQNHDPMRFRCRIWSVRDYLFCFHQRLFYEFTPDWSPAKTSNPTRAGVLTSLESGPNTLSAYCTRLAQNVGWPCMFEYLELLVAEELTGIGPCIEGPSRVVDLERVRALVNLGVSMDKVLSRVPMLLADYMEGQEQNDLYCDIEVIRYLLDNGALVDGWVLQQALWCQNTDILALTIQNATNIQQQGADVVVKAATANDFEAVKMLLDAGVDVNTETRSVRIPVGLEVGRRLKEAVSLIFQVVGSWKLSFEALNNMIDYLVQRGAHFRLSAMKPHLSDLLESVLKHKDARSEGLLKQIVQYIIDMGCDLSDPNVPSARLLEACGFLGGRYGEELEKMDIFESMFRNGALLRPGAPLAAWIGIGGGAELVNEMLCCGADINTYYHGDYPVRTALQWAAEFCREDLVELLLQKGAEVNAPASGPDGRTALQAICNYESISPAEKEQQIRIINILLSYGANINAAPARDLGYTSLQCAAERGDLEVAMLLLSWDPPADVDMPSCQNPSDRICDGNALDLAAAQGRIDMVKLLLNNYALSSRPGDTGYDGAIKEAEESGRLAVADLIREHAMEVLISNPTRAHESWPQRDWREYACEYDGYSDGYTIFDEDAKDVECSGSGDGFSESADGFSESGDRQDPVAQAEIQPEAVVHPGSEHMAPEAGWVRDTEVNNPLDFEIGSANLPEIGHMEVDDPLSLNFDISSPTLLDIGDMEVDNPLNFEVGSATLLDIGDMEVDDPLTLNFEFGPATLLEIGDMEVNYDLDYDPSASHIDTAASGWGVGQ